MMLAYTYIEKGKFDLVEKAKLMLIEATDEEFIFPNAIIMENVKFIYYIVVDYVKCIPQRSKNGF